MADTTLRKELLESLKRLHLPGFRACFEDVARQAENEDWSYEKYLWALSEQECQERDLRRRDFPMANDYRILSRHGFPSD
jgi:DNA replication protein DnaC